MPRPSRWTVDCKQLFCSFRTPEASPDRPLPWASHTMLDVSPLPDRATKLRHSLSQQSKTNVAVTVSPFRHLNSKPSEHHLVSGVSTLTLPSCFLENPVVHTGLRKVRPFSRMTRKMRLGFRAGNPALVLSRFSNAVNRRYPKEGKRSRCAFNFVSSC